MSEPRWDRLAGDLQAAGVPDVRVDEKSYGELVRGRATFGVTRSVTIRRADGQLIEVHDSWWRKNPEVWTGWTVTRSDANDFVVDRAWGLKLRSDVVAAVRRMLDWQELPA